MRIYTRLSLVAGESAPAADGRPALLLEGSWPAVDRAPDRWSLDESIDGRFGWIDAEAARLAELLGRQTAVAAPPANFNAPAAAPPCPADLHALALRYYLVKLLRPVAFCQQVISPAADTRCELFATRGRDEDYADLLAELARQGNFQLQIHWRPADRCAEIGPGQGATPQNSPARRTAAKLAAGIDRARVALGATRRTQVVLCGNPRALDPLCAELLTRQVGVAWLYDRFAFGSWRRWSWRGVGQLVCNSDQPASGSAVSHSTVWRPSELEACGLQLGPIVDRWLAVRTAESGPRLARYFEQAHAHLRRQRPHAILLDQDATPLARATVAAARQLAIPSWVVQHGVPGVRFGFAPLAADRFCAADRGSHRQLLQWGVSPERIVVTGSPALDELRRRFGRRDRRRGEAHRKRPTGPRVFLFLASTPPRDERPDSVTFHLTTETYRELLDRTCRMLAKVAGAELLVKPHPRDPQATVLHDILRRYPRLTASITAESRLERLLPATDVVLSCGSTGGVEAAALGWPVVQFLPRGSGDLLTAQDWQLLGTVRTDDEWAALFRRALDWGRSGSTTANGSRELSAKLAARQIVDFVLAERRPAAGDPAARSSRSPTALIVRQAASQSMLVEH